MTQPNPNEPSRTQGSGGDGTGAAQATTQWRLLCPGVRTAELRFANGWSFRSVAVDLVGGGTCVVSPTRGMSSEELDAPEFLLAPNHFHWLGIVEWLSLFPEAQVATSGRASKRLDVKLGMSLHGLGALAERLPENVTLVEPAGTANGEVWLGIEAGLDRFWVVCDAFFNEPTSPTGLWGLGCRLTGTTPGLRIGATWKLLALADQRAYRKWALDYVERTRPTCLVPAHGALLADSGLADTLSALLSERLR